jgi:hypothetical protein
MAYAYRVHSFYHSAHICWGYCKIYKIQEGEGNLPDKETINLISWWNKSPNRPTINIPFQIFNSAPFFFLFFWWHPVYIDKEEFEYTKGVIRIRQLKDRKHNSQTKKRKKDKQLSPKQCTENWKSSNTNFTKTP